MSERTGVWMGKKENERLPLASDPLCSTNCVLGEVEFCRSISLRFPWPAFGFKVRDAEYISEILELVSERGISRRRFLLGRRRAARSHGTTSAEPSLTTRFARMDFSLRGSLGSCSSSCSCCYRCCQWWRSVRGAIGRSRFCRFRRCHC